MFKIYFKFKLVSLNTARMGFLLLLYLVAPINSQGEAEKSNSKGIQAGGATLKEAVEDCFSSLADLKETSFGFLTLIYNFPNIRLISEEQKVGELIFEHKPRWTCLGDYVKCTTKSCHNLPAKVSVVARDESKTRSEQICRSTAAELFQNRKYRTGKLSMTQESIRAPSLKSRWRNVIHSEEVDPKSIEWTNYLVWVCKLEVEAAPEVDRK